MAKQAKMKQTDYNIAGKNISDTASPLYQENLQRLGQYLNDPTSYIDKYLNQYYGANAVQNQDFLRQYNRAMNQRTGANYAATGGGYTSSGQRAYDDRQRYYNDLLSRLQKYGVSSARGMYDQDVANTRGANVDYYNAYNLGKAYSDVDQYNYQVDQANSNWWAPAVSAVGRAAMSVAPLTGVAAPFVAAAGAGATGLGDAFTVQVGNTPSNTWGQTFQNTGNDIANVDWGSLFNQFKNRNQTLSQKVGYNYTPYNTSTMAQNTVGNNNYFSLGR